MQVIARFVSGHRRQVKVVSQAPANWLHCRGRGDHLQRLVAHKNDLQRAADVDAQVREFAHSTERVRPQPMRVLDDQQGCFVMRGLLQRKDTGEPEHFAERFEFKLVTELAQHALE